MKNDKWNVDEMFDEVWKNGDFELMGLTQQGIKTLKDFIHTALSKQAEEIMSKMPSEKEYEFGKESIDDNVDGFNEALSETKKIISGFISPSQK